jgi:hypothetical protein
VTQPGSAETEPGCYLAAHSLRTARFYLLADGDSGLSRVLRAFAERWREHAEHFPRIVHDVP